MSDKYTFYYNDGSFLTYTIDDEHIGEVYKATLEKRALIVPDIGLFRTEDIRSIIKQKPEPVVTEENPSYNPDLSKHEQDWLDAMKLAERPHQKEGRWYESRIKARGNKG